MSMPASTDPEPNAKPEPGAAPSPTGSNLIPHLAGALLLRLALFTLLWWMLSENRWSEPVLVAAVILVTTACSFLLWPIDAWRWRPLAVLAFIPWFLWQSLCGGFDVARRAFQRRPALQPQVVTMTIDLPVNASCLFAWIVSLLPGTACVYREQKQFKIHLLDESSLPKVKELEQRIARLLRDPR